MKNDKILYGLLIVCHCYLYLWTQNCDATNSTTTTTQRQEDVGQKIKLKIIGDSSRQQQQQQQQQQQLLVQTDRLVNHSLQLQSISSSVTVRKSNNNNQGKVDNFVAAKVIAPTEVSGQEGANAASSYASTSAGKVVTSGLDITANKLKHELGEHVINKRFKRLVDVKLSARPPKRIKTPTTTTTTTTTTTSTEKGTTLAEEAKENEGDSSEDEDDGESENETNEQSSAKVEPTSTTTIATTIISESSKLKAARKSSSGVRKQQTSDGKEISNSAAYEQQSTPTASSKVTPKPTKGKPRKVSLQTPSSSSSSSSSSPSPSLYSSKSKGKETDKDNDDDGKENDQSVTASDTTKTPTNATSSTSAKRKKKPLVPLPFIKTKNESICTPEAYLEFPRDLIGNKWRARGLVIIHIAVVCYMFYSLALVCERYFMPSLEEFSQRLQLSEDVAGATLMSAGSSAPELFTAVLGVFIAKGDVGTGAIVGSAVFNILFVIGICAFVSTTSAQLEWWPVLRDSIFYTFTVLVLILFIYDERITALESFSMIALYGVYIHIMIHNEAIKERVTRILQSYPLTANLISSSTPLEGADDVFSTGSLPESSTEKQRSFFGSGWNQPPNYQTTSMTTTANKKTVEDDSIFMAAMLIIVQHKRLFRSQLRFQSAARYIIIKRQHRQQLKQQKSANKYTPSEVNYFGPENELESGKGKGANPRREAYAKTATMSKCKFSIVSKDDYEFWNRPPEEGENYYIWMAKIPVNYVLHYTIPDCSLYPDRFLFTFFLSIAWTAFFSYIMVWMVTLIGYTFGIPDSVMGFTFLAAGTSIPDCYSSIHAARNGMANMAVSNSIGSNVFDILIGLSLPWFIQTAIYPGVVATINSRGVIYSVVLLFLSLIVTIYLMNKYEWTLKPRLGLALLIAYGLFIVLTCMLEFNLFGHVNPPACLVADG